MRLRYSLEESVDRVRIRSDDIIKRKRKHTTMALSAGITVLSLMLIVSVYELAGFGNPVIDESVYGSYMLSQNAGGYVLVAVIAFTLGIIIAAAIRHFRSKKKGGD